MAHQYTPRTVATSAELPPQCPVCKADTAFPGSGTYGCGGRFAQSAADEPWTGFCPQYDERLANPDAPKADAA